MNEPFVPSVVIPQIAGRPDHGLGRPTCTGWPKSVASQNRPGRRPETAREVLPLRRSRRTLLPLDIKNCPLEVFPLVNEFAGGHGTSLTLLHVLSAGAPELGRWAEAQLERLARRFLSLNLAPRLRIRLGSPAPEILAEASETNADLIILTRYKSPSPRTAPSQPGIAEQVMNAAPSRSLRLEVRTRFNCETQWEIVDEVVAALDYVGLLKPASIRVSDAT